jgi:dihydrolipoamide dehydrogenase
MEKFDLVVVGSGPGGYVAAIRASQLGLKAAVVEKEKVGGVCLNWGCIPTKALIKNAEVVNLFKKGKEFGISYENMNVDFSVAVKRSRKAAMKLSKGIEYLMKKNNITLVKGHGKLTGPNTVQVEQEEGSVELEAKNILLATGSRPKAVPGMETDGEKIITTTEAMLLDEPPQSLIIVGAGAIGIEFAYVYSAYGTEVTVVEMLDSVLPIEDKEITEQLRASFKKRGINIYTSSKVEKIDKDGERMKVSVSTEKETKEIIGDKILVAIGRDPNSENLGLEKLKVETDRGLIKVDKNFETNVKGVFAIGDIIGAPLLAHAASEEGIACVEYIVEGKEPQINHQNIPSCTYCQPQVASVGLTEEKAREKGHEIEIGIFPFRANGKAQALDEMDGVVKIIADKKYKEILGAHIIGSEATEMIAELTLAKRLESTVEELATTVHAHPTLSEVVGEAALAVLGRAIHI